LQKVHRHKDIHELLEIGYKGSLSSVHRYIASIKEAKQIKAKTTTRVETEPGKQMQYDWKEWDLPVEGKILKVYLHEVVLSYSRKKYYVSSLSITGQDVIRAIMGGYRLLWRFCRGIDNRQPKANGNNP